MDKDWKRVEWINSEDFENLKELMTLRAILVGGKKDKKERKKNIFLKKNVSLFTIA